MLKIGCPDDLYSVMNDITVRIARMETCLLGICREFRYVENAGSDEPNIKCRFGIMKFSGEWKIAWLDPKKVQDMPIRDCAVEVKIDFAEIAFGFWKAYEKHTDSEIGRLICRANAALEELNKIF